MTTRQFSLVPAIFGILTFALTLSLVLGERPGVPLVTPSLKLHATFADIQVQLTQVGAFGKHAYIPCEGHVVRKKLRSDETGQPELVKIEEREGGFILPGLQPKTEYLILVACKALGADGHSHVGDFTQPLVIRTSDFEEPEEKHEEAEAEVWDLPAPLKLVQPEEDNQTDSTNQSTITQIFGATGEWKRLRCETSRSPDPGFPMIFKWEFENKTVENSREFKISNTYGNKSELKIFLKNKSRLGTYECKLLVDEKTEEVIHTFILYEGKRPPKFKLIPEWVEMTSANFKTEIIGSDANEDHFLVGHVVFYKKNCHLAGDWIAANITEKSTGFTIQDLRPNESYCMKVALKNRVTTGSFDQYWSIHTSSACAIRNGNGAASTLRKYHSVFVTVVQFIFIVILLT